MTTHSLIQRHTKGTGLKVLPPVQEQRHFSFKNHTKFYFSLDLDTNTVNHSRSIDQYYPLPPRPSLNSLYSAFRFSMALSRPSSVLIRWSTLDFFSQSGVSRDRRTHPSTRPPTRTAVVSVLAVLSVTMSPNSQSARTVFTTQNTRFTTHMSSRRRTVSTQ